MFIKFNYLLGTNVLQILFVFIICSVVTLVFPSVFPKASLKFADFIFGAFVGLHLRKCTLLHVYVLSVRPVH